MWGRLSLRVQAAIAVAVPVLVLAIFTALYFPARLNAQAAEALERQGITVGLLAVTNAAPTVGLLREGLASQAELQAVLDGVRAGGAYTHLGILAVPTDKLVPRGADRVMTLAPKDGLQVQGDLPPGEYEVPLPGQCVASTAGELEVRCTARMRDADFEVVLVSRSSLAGLAAQEQENRVTGLWVLLAALALGLVLALVFSQALAGPIGVVTQVAREVAEGELSVAAVEVQSGGGSEVQSMAVSINEMLVSLKRLVREMVSLTGQLGTAARGLTSAAGDQEHVTSQQSAYAQQIAATFEELSRTAESITRSTEVVEQAARRTSQGVDEARAVVAQMVSGMGDIRREAKDVSGSITRLNEELKQVARIALVIKQVADRSDLLALNAALEGTKAGEVGRGFSVVAAELRKLAESVGQGSRDISRIVEQVQLSGAQAVERAHQGVAASEHGMQVAEQASTVFEQILELSRGTTTAAQQIAVATRQQKQSSEQAVAGARNVAELVKRGVDATGRTTRIAQELQASVVALTEVTGRFKVDQP